MKNRPVRTSSRWWAYSQKEQTMQNVAFRFRRPSGSERQQPSRTMTEALHRLGQSDEMQSLLLQATKNGQMVTIEVYQNHSGEPILIHIKKEEA